MPQRFHLPPFSEQIISETGREMLPNDPFMLLSFINMKLRDKYSSLDELCEDLEIDKSDLIKKLSDIDYGYIEELNAFK